METQHLAEYARNIYDVLINILEHCTDRTVVNCIFVHKLWRPWVEDYFQRRVLRSNGDSIPHPMFDALVQKMSIAQSVEDWRLRIIRNAILCDIEAFRHPLLLQWNRVREDELAREELKRFLAEAESEECVLTQDVSPVDSVDGL